MTYTIHWSKKSEKFLEKLPRDISYRIVHKVNSIKDEPFHFVEHFEGESYFKLRIGDYRVLVDIKPSDKLIEVRVVGHRSNIYKKI
jgi:mRNA interferase RelE/StbE